MSSKYKHWSGRSLCLLGLFLALIFMTSGAQSKNPDLSYWMANVSEGSLPSELGEHDFTPEIAVVGDTVHVMWLTRNKDWSGYKLYYRRSTDNGKYWEQKKLLFESNDIVTDESYRRMAVSGNTVHIAVNHYEGSWYGVLTYIRSTDNGTTFDAPRNLFTAANAFHVYDVYVSAEGSNATIGFRNQCNWCVDNSYNLKISSDNGGNFVDGTAYSTRTGSSWGVSDMQRVGNNIYVLYHDAYYYYGLVYSKLYVAASHDGGANFNSTKLSFPSKNGDDKQGATLQDYHYVPKIAAEGNNISVIWNGLDAQDVYSIFYSRSTDAGTNWEAVQNLTQGTPAEGKALQHGQETLTLKGNYVYTLFISSAANPYLRRSVDGGSSFLGLQELTTATPYTNQAWWPVIKTDPRIASGSSVYILWTYPTFVYSGDGGVTFTKPEVVITTFSLGNFPFGAQSPQMAIGNDGKLHYVSQVQYYTTDLCGGYCDYDIMYRGITEAPSPSAGDQALRVVSDDSNRYDNMQVRANSWLDMTSKLTAEVWVKPYPGGITTGTTSAIKPIFHKQATGGYDFAYTLQTLDRYDKRQAAAEIKTPAGIFSVNPTSATEGLIQDGVWTHLALTYDATGGANNLKLYMNGQLIATGTATGNLSTADGLFLAGRYGIWEIDELRIWGVVRTQSEIASTMYITLNGTESALNAYYNFNGTTRDITGHGNDGILMYKEEFTPGGIVGPNSLVLPTRGGWRAILKQ